MDDATTVADPNLDFVLRYLQFFPFQFEIFFETYSSLFREVSDVKICRFSIKIKIISILILLIFV